MPVAAVGVRACRCRKKYVVPDPAVAGPEHEREAERPEQHAAQTGVGDALEHDVRDFTGSSEPGLEHHEAGLHEEHEERRDQHPHRVERIDDVVRLRRELLAEHGGPGLRTEVPSEGPHAEYHDAEPEHLAPEIRTEISARIGVLYSHFQGCDHHAT